MGNYLSLIDNFIFFNQKTWKIVIAMMIKEKKINKNISAIAKQTQYNVISFTRQDYKKIHAANTEIFHKK